MGLKYPSVGQNGIVIMLNVKANGIEVFSWFFLLSSRVVIKGD